MTRIAQIMRRKNAGVVATYRWDGHPPDESVVLGAPVVRHVSVLRRSDFAKCLKCGKLRHEHGYVGTSKREFRVCPGDYVVVEDGKITVERAATFHKRYEAAE